MAGIAFKLPSWFGKRPDAISKQEFEELINIITALNAVAAKQGLPGPGQVNPDWKKIVSTLSESEINDALNMSVILMLDNIIRPIFLAWSTFAMVVEGGEEQTEGEKDALKKAFSQLATALLNVAAGEAVQIANLELGLAAGQDDSADDYGTLEEYGE